MIYRMEFQNLENFAVCLERQLKQLSNQNDTGDAAYEHLRQARLKILDAIVCMQTARAVQITADRQQGV